MTTPLNTFVIILRQGPFAFADADRKLRAELTGEWARDFNAKGHKLDPHILTAETVQRGAELPHAAEMWPITALLFIEARSLADATNVAELHPALQYNANVEIRAWGTPAQIAAGASAFADVASSASAP